MYVIEIIFWILFGIVQISNFIFLLTGNSFIGENNESLRVDINISFYIVATFIILARYGDNIFSFLFSKV